MLGFDALAGLPLAGLPSAGGGPVVTVSAADPASFTLTASSATAEIAIASEATSLTITAQNSGGNRIYTSNASQSSYSINVFGASSLFSYTGDATPFDLDVIASDSEAHRIVLSNALPINFGLTFSNTRQVLDFDVLQAGGGSGTVTLKYWDGSSWVAKPLSYWNGSAWV